MTKEFFQYLKKLKRRAYAEIFLTFGDIFFLIFATVFFRWKIGFISFVTLFLISVVLTCVLKNLDKRAEKRKKPWEFVTEPKNFQDLIKIFNGDQITDNSYCTFTKWRHMKVRVLLQNGTEFESKAASKQRNSANRKINAKYGINSEVPMADVSKMMRINIFACDRRNDFLLRWIQYSERTLDRLEAIVNVGYELDTFTLLFPSVPLGTESLGAYQCAAELLFDRF